MENAGDEQSADLRSTGRPDDVAPWLPDAWWDLTLVRRRQIAGAVVAVVVAIPVLWLVTAGGDDSGSTAGAGTTTTTTVDPAAFVASLPPDRVATWDALAECEATGDWSADTGNGFYGGLQFTQQSWAAMGGTGNPAAASREEQIMRGEALQAQQGWTAWPACSAQLGLT